jgi:hypothetical protein
MSPIFMGALDGWDDQRQCAWAGRRSQRAAPSPDLRHAFRKAWLWVYTPPKLSLIVEQGIELVEILSKHARPHVPKGENVNW